MLAAAIHSRLQAKSSDAVIPHTLGVYTERL